MKIKFLILINVLLLFFCLLSAQENDNNYIALYEKKDYNKSMEIIHAKLTEIYGKRVEDKRIPAGYIALKKTGDDENLVKLFRTRKEKGFFIEENNELAELHFYAGRCSVKLNKRKDAMNHFIQSLRFRKIEFSRDDEIYYEISQIFKSFNEPLYFNGYIDALEQAYTLNPKKYIYSYELGNALAVKGDKRKAIYHLTRYAENSEDKITPELYLKLGSLSESIEKYIEAEKYYNEYLRMKPENAEILFALGYLAYFRTGNYVLAESSLLRAIQILKESDFYRRSKSFEYLGDMSFNNLKFDKALSYYIECFVYQNKILEKINKKNTEQKEVTDKINKVKEALITKKEFEKYEDYEILKEDKSKIERDIEILQLEYKKLQPGRVRWYMAETYEKMGNYDDAIKYYREAIKYDYNSNNSREMIVKLQLKIKRGY
jgi:tetratricopeptide (TPR) repeat protein